MDIRPITPDYAVSPQISPEDCAAIAAAGFKMIICNRPDAEIPPQVQADAVASEAAAYGLAFVVIPVTHQGLNMDIVAEQRGAMDTADGPVLAYCASGTRCSIVWSLTQATQMAPEDIIAATAAAGYDLQGMHGQLQMIADQAAT